MTESEARRLIRAIGELLKRPRDDYEAAAVTGVERVWADEESDGRWFVGIHFGQGTLRRGYRQVDLANPIAITDDDPAIEPEEMAGHLYDLIMEPHGTSGRPDSEGRYWWA